MKDGSSTVRPQDIQIPKEVIALVPIATAQRFHVCPLAVQESASGAKKLAIAIADPKNLLVLDQLQQLTGCRISPIPALEADIQRGLEKHYSTGNYTAAPMDLLDQIDPGATTEAPLETVVSPTGSEAGGTSGASGKVEEILHKAISERASDIHIEPHADGILVRFRIDGMLYDELNYDLPTHTQIISRIKIMSKLDIAQNRLPQDGRFPLKAFDVRVSLVPSIYGEKAVLRMLPKSPLAMDFKQLGMEGRNLECLTELLGRHYGMLLATGPTGSGKTTTLYSCLSKIDCIGKNVITVEDPVEYQFPRMTQIQVHPKIGLTFAAGLRSILRQDPDVVMVGEIRDLETLEIAIQAALTGHMVISTLHCNDAAAGAARMVDMGAEPFLVSSAINGIIAQRLVRKICPQCKAQATLTEEAKRKLNLADDGAVYYQGVGCQNCRGTGYSGRVSVYEVVPMIEPIQQAIIRKAPAVEIRGIIREAGLPTMYDDGMAKVRAGVTSLEEMIRAVSLEKS